MAGFRPPFSFRTGKYSSGRQLNTALQANFDFIAGKLQAITNGIAGLSNATPLSNGVAAPGTGLLASRDDHIHPTDSSRLSATASVGGDLSGSMPNPKVKFLAVSKWGVD